MNVHVREWAYLSMNHFPNPFAQSPIIAAAADAPLLGPAGARLKGVLRRRAGNVRSRAEGDDVPTLASLLVNERRAQEYQVAERLRETAEEMIEASPDPERRLEGYIALIDAALSVGLPTESYFEASVEIVEHQLHLPLLIKHTIYRLTAYKALPSALVSRLQALQVPSQDTFWQLSKFGFFRREVRERQKITLADEERIISTVKGMGEDQGEDGFKILLDFARLQHQVGRDSTETIDLAVSLLSTVFSSPRNNVPDIFKAGIECEQYQETIKRIEAVFDRTARFMEFLKIVRNTAIPASWRRLVLLKMDVLEPLPDANKRPALKDLGGYQHELCLFAAELLGRPLPHYPQFTHDILSIQCPECAGVYLAYADIRRAAGFEEEADEIMESLKKRLRQTGEGLDKMKGYYALEKYDAKKPGDASLLATEICQYIESLTSKEQRCHQAGHSADRIATASPLLFEAHVREWGEQASALSNVILSQRILKQLIVASAKGMEVLLRKKSSPSLLGGV